MDVKRSPGASLGDDVIPRRDVDKNINKKSQASGEPRQIEQALLVRSKSAPLVVQRRITAFTQARSAARSHLQSAKLALPADATANISMPASPAKKKTAPKPLPKSPLLLNKQKQPLQSPATALIPETALAKLSRKEQKAAFEQAGKVFMALDNQYMQFQQLGKKEANALVAEMNTCRDEASPEITVKSLQAFRGVSRAGTMQNIKRNYSTETILSAKHFAQSWLAMSVGEDGSRLGKSWEPVVTDMARNICSELAKAGF